MHASAQSFHDAAHGHGASAPSASSVPGWLRKGRLRRLVGLTSGAHGFDRHPSGLEPAHPQDRIEMGLEIGTRERCRCRVTIDGCDEERTKLRRWPELARYDESDQEAMEASPLQRNDAAAVAVGEREEFG